MGAKLKLNAAARTLRDNDARSPGQSRHPAARPRLPGLTQAV